MLRLWIFISLVLVLSEIDASAVTDADYKFNRTFPSSRGDVVFDHEAHAMGRVRDCATCHSALKTFGGKVDELFGHTFCKSCHEEEEGPTECSGCHKNRTKDKEARP